jgi:uncharacterized protein (TIGR00255 family)
MMNSMTGYARTTAEGEWGQLVWECRCVNHRYLEVTLKLPEALRAMEPLVREKIKSTVSRGKLECSARWTPGPSIQTNFTLNTSLLETLLSKESEVNTLAGTSGSAAAFQWLKWPEVLQSAPQDTSSYFTEMLKGLTTCLEAFSASRAKEGEAISGLIRDRLVEVRRCAEAVRPLVPEALNALRTKYQEKCAQLMQEGDPARLEQEMVLCAQKMDIDEELDRLLIHADAVESALKAGSPVGRRLDFLMQELNREANTLSSKSTDLEISQKAVDLKVLIEQMREQVQNVE